MGEVVKFPNQRALRTDEQIDRAEYRLSELENENTWIRQDLTELGNILEKNIKEMQTLLRELAKMQGFEEPIDLSFDDSDDLEPDF